MTQHIEYDFAVVGGGPVGAVMALGLAEQGYQVALIERQAAPKRAQTQRLEKGLHGVDARTVALSLASKELLDRYGAWPQQGIGAFAHMEVWEDRGTSVLRFGASDVEQDVLGHIAQVGPWIAQLWEQLESSSVSCVVGRSLADVQQEAEGYRLILAHSAASSDEPEQTLFTRTLIAADGAQSAVRRALAVPMALSDTGQSALAFAAQVENVHEQTAFQRFLADGPLALLPMADSNLVSVVWSAVNDRADELSALSTAKLAQALSRASEERLGRVEDCIAPFRFPLRQGVISSFCPRPNVIFIGDAARVIHPLAGQGVNLGFEDVRALLACTAPEAFRSRRSTRRLRVSQLQRFARVRRARSRLAVALMSGLSRSYASQSPGLLLARNAVTRALGKSDIARRALVLEAMGLGPVAQSS